MFVAVSTSDSTNGKSVGLAGSIGSEGFYEMPTLRPTAFISARHPPSAQGIRVEFSADLKSVSRTYDCPEPGSSGYGTAIIR